MKKSCLLLLGSACLFTVGFATTDAIDVTATINQSDLSPCAYLQQDHVTSYNIKDAMGNIFPVGHLAPLGTPVTIDLQHADNGIAAVYFDVQGNFAMSSDSSCHYVAGKKTVHFTFKQDPNFYACYITCQWS